MDVLRSKEIYTEYAAIIDKYIDEYNTPYGLIGNLPDVYSQMVAHLLKDADNKSWYEGMPTHIGSYLDGPRSSYNSFLRYISKLKEDYLPEPMVVNSFYKPVDVIVPEDSYFMLGDNRNNSEDSRFWPKMFLNKKDILAKALFVYWPLNRIGIIK